MSDTRRAPASRRRRPARWTRTAVAIVATCGLAARAVALDLGDEGLGNDSTLAFREGLRRWDNSKRFGAERVGDHDRAMYLPDGMRSGNYLIYPTLGTTVLFDDNIYGTAKNRVSDVRFEIVPVVRAKSELPRHILDFAVGAKLTEYVRHEELNSADFRFNMDGALHFDHAHTLAVSVLSAFEHEDLAAPDAPKGAIEKTAVFHNRVTAGLKRDAGRLWASFGASIERWDFQDVKARDGSIIDQDNRDAQVASANTMAGYRLSPGFELQGKLRVLRQTSLGAAKPDLSAYGYEAVAGLAAELNPLLRWRLLGGYGMRDYDSSDLKTTGNGILEGEIQWLPTQLMTLTGTVRRAYAEGIYGDGAGGRIDNALALKLEYEALRNLVFTLSGEYRESEFFGADRRDRVTTARFGADYYYTKNWLFTLALEHQGQQSNTEANTITRNRIWLSTKLRF